MDEIAYQDLVKVGEVLEIKKSRLSDVIAKIATPPMLATLKVKAYILEDNEQCPFSPVTLEMVKDIGVVRWAIFRHGNVLGKTPNSDGRFIFHVPQRPSNRDVDYYKEYRFGSARAGYEFWNKNRENILATQIEMLEYFD